MAVDNAGPGEQGPAAGSAGPAVLDPQHTGDIVGALGTLKQSETGHTRSWRRKFRLLLVIVGPGLIVMGGGNDAGGVQVYAQMGQDYGMKLLWTLLLLFPILFFCQEMVVRLGAVSGVGHGRLIFARFGRFWGTFSVADLFVINAVTIVIEFIGVEQSLSFFGVPGFWAVAVSAVLLFAVMAGGTRTCVRGELAIFQEPVRSRRFIAVTPSADANHQVVCGPILNVPLLFRERDASRFRHRPLIALAGRL